MLDHIWVLLTKVLRRSEANLTSKEAARQRLQFVLVQDRFALPSQTLEDMKNDLVEVISRYVIIDPDSIGVEIKRSAGTVVLVSNIPIAGLRQDFSRGGASPSSASS
ncbi:MAG: cell division topological specificity factor MinE [Bacteroidota bacterium]